MPGQLARPVLRGDRHSNVTVLPDRDVRPVKVQQRTSGGCWRTLAGLADFAIVRSYLSTATKWGMTSLDVLEQLFTTGAWLPPAAAPTE
jgi:transposase